MNYTDKDLAALIKSVEEEFDLSLKEIKEAKEKETEQVEATEIEKNEKAASESTDEFDYDEDDIKVMNEMYASMSKSEAQAHLESLNKTLGVSVKTEENSEIKKSEEIFKSENDLLKKEVDGVKKENEELKKSLSGLLETLKGKVFSAAPARKSITNIDYIAKSEVETSKPSKETDVSTFSTKEISSILSNKMREGKLSKSERELVVSFYDKKANINDIKHLL